MPAVGEIPAKLSWTLIFLMFQEMADVIFGFDSGLAEIVHLLPVEIGITLLGISNVCLRARAPASASWICSLCRFPSRISGATPNSYRKWSCCRIRSRAVAYSAGGPLRCRPRFESQCS